MNANAGPRGRSRVRDQEEHELADMFSAPYPEFAVHSRDIRRTHYILPQTERHSLWRWVSDHYPILISLAVVIMVALGLYLTPAIDIICSLLFPETDDANSFKSGIAYNSATSSSILVATTSLLASSGNRHSQTHYAQIRKHSTSSVNAIPSDSTTSNAWAPGLYLIPMSMSRESAMLQSTSFSESSPMTLGKQQVQEHIPHPFTTFSSISATLPKATAPTVKHPAFVFWGVTMLPPSNHITFSDRIFIFCVKNVCSTNTTLASRCNNGIPEAVYERKECEWCWDNSSHVYHPNGTALHVHCQEVVKHSVKTLWIVGSLCLFPLLIIATILLRRCIASQKRKRPAAKHPRKSTQGFKPGKTGGSGGDHVMLNPTGGNNQKGREVARKSLKWCRRQKSGSKIGEKEQEIDMTATKDRNMITRTDMPHSIDTGIFSNIRGMGQGKLLEGSNSQEDSLGLSRTSSRRERVLQSRNATVPTILIHRARGSSSNAEAHSGPECAN